MKRVDLTNELLNKTIQDIRDAVRSKIDELLSFAGIVFRYPSLEDAPFEPVCMVWRYASADKEVMWKHDLLADTGRYPSEEIRDIWESLFRPALGFQSSMNIPKSFWDTPLGFACSVAQARNKLDNFFPLSIMDLSLLSDRKHTTLQQHCQRGSIKAVKDGGWKVPPLEALRYLKSIGSEPFATYYSLDRYGKALGEWLKNDVGQFLSQEDVSKFYKLNGY